MTEHQEAQAPTQQTRRNDDLPRHADLSTVGVQLLALEGHVQPAAIAALDESVVGDPSQLILDLMSVQRLGTHALSLLIAALRRMDRGGIHVSVVCVEPTVRRAFELATGGDVDLYASTALAVERASAGSSLG